MDFCRSVTKGGIPPGCTVRAIDGIEGFDDGSPSGRDASVLRWLWMWIWSPQGSKVAGTRPR